MCFLEIQPLNVHLKGISRTANFTLTNHNEFLAVSYQLHFRQYEADNHPLLSLFPEKGILMKGQSQKIKVKYKGGGGQSTIEQFSESIIVRFTFKIEYNRSFMLKSKLKGWQQIPEQVQQQQVEVQVGGEKQAVQHEIKEDIIFNQQFKAKELNISAIHESKNKSFINEISYENLAIESKLTEIGSSQPKNKDKNGFANPKLPIDQLCSLQYGESRVGKVKKQGEKNEAMRYEFVQSRMVNEANKSFELSMKTVGNNELSMNQSARSPSSRGAQLVILAIIAAFFVALGNNIGRIVS